MTYAIKEMFFTYQGEGALTGRPAIFLRFAGCNLWSGLEKDRSEAVCKFCDTEFVGTDGPGGGKFKAPRDLAKKAAALWPGNSGNMMIVCTGGEPLLQLDEALIKALQAEGFMVAVETNGTIAAPKSLDWVCVSPKADAALVQKAGDELKLVYPQVENTPEDFAGLNFKVFSLQPKDDPDNRNNTTKNIAATLKYCAAHPKWRLSLQAHKIWNIA